jgi:uridine kinase
MRSFERRHVAFLTRKADFLYYRGAHGYVSRVTVLGQLTATIADMATNRRVLVAFDGPDAGGKTTMANRVAAALPGAVVRASVEGFHRRREVRMARGLDSPEGYYRDSFNLEALEEELLSPFLAGNGLVRTRVFDYRTDEAVEAEFEAVPPSATLIIDGVFLLRPELRRWWNLGIYVHVPDEVSLARAIVRDSDVYGGPEETEVKYRSRYLPGQALYRMEAHPQDAALIVIDNSDPDRPEVLKWDVAARV